MPSLVLQRPRWSEILLALTAYFPEVIRDPNQEGFLSLDKASCSTKSWAPPYWGGLGGPEALHPLGPQRGQFLEAVLSVCSGYPASPPGPHPSSKAHLLLPPLGSLLCLPQNHGSRPYSRTSVALQSTYHFIYVFSFSLR